MDTYFAALPYFSTEYGQRLQAKVDRHYSRLPQQRWYQRAKRNYQLYYGLPGDASPFDVGEVGQTGEQGELSQVHVNHFHHLGQRVLTLAIQDEFGWQPEAANGDAQAQAEAVIGSSVLEYEKRDKRLGRKLHTTAETALIYMQGFQLVEWDVRGGARYDVDPTTGAAIYEGRLKVTTHTPLRVIYDRQRKDAEHRWVIVTEFVSKYDLAARYPGKDGELAAKLLNLAPDHQAILDWRKAAFDFSDDTDLVPLYRFFHVPCEAVPQGRETVFVAGGLVLSDGPTTHGERLPIIRMAPGDMIDTPEGSSPMTDISGLQAVYNMLMSTAVTNNANGGVANIWAPKAANLGVVQLEGGQNVWETEGDVKPEAINFAHTAPETFELAELVKQTMQQLVGMSDTAMGQVDPQLSGAAMALLDSKSLQFATLFIASRQQAIEDLGTAILRLYKRHARAPRQLEVIVGNGRKHLLKDFTGAKLGSIDRVTVEAKSALTDTNAGRLDLAEKLITMGALGPEKAQDLIQVLRTGSLDPILQGEELEQLLIAAENDLIAKGQTPQALLTDPHLLHIRHHRAAGASPEARADPIVMQALVAHTQQHIDLWRSTDPALLAALGTPPPPPPLPPPGMDPAMLPPGVPPPPGPEAGGLPPAPADVGALVQPGPDAGPQPSMPSMPQMPVNPSTGERAPAPPMQ